MPPHTPNSMPSSSACARHSVRTGQVRQNCLASRCAAPATNRSSASAVRHFAAPRQFHCSVMVALLDPAVRSSRPAQENHRSAPSPSEPSKNTQPAPRDVPDEGATTGHVPSGPVGSRALRSIGLLIGFCVLAGVLVAGMAFPVVAGVGLVSNDAGDSINAVSADVVDGPLPQATVVTDSTGAAIARFFEPNQNRISARPDQVSPAMKAAIVAVEDRRFYQHQGVDWQGTIRAVVTNQVSGDIQ